MRFPPNLVSSPKTGSVGVWFPNGTAGSGAGAGAGACACAGSGAGSGAGAVCWPGGSGSGSTDAGGCPGLGGGATLSGTGGADENKFVREDVNFLYHGRASSVALEGSELNQSAIPPPDFLRKLR